MPAPETYAGAPLFEDLAALLVLLTRPQRLKAGGRELFVRVERELTERLVDLPAWLPVPQPARLRIEAARATADELGLTEVRGAGTKAPALGLTDQGRQWLGLTRERQLQRLLAPGRAALAEAREGRLVGPAAWGLSPVLGRVTELCEAFTLRAAEPVSMEAFLAAEAADHNPLAPGEATDLFGQPLDDHQRAAVWRRALVTVTDHFLVPSGGLELGRLDDGFTIRLTDVGRYVLGTATHLELPPPADAAEVLVQPDFEIVFLAPDPGLAARLAPIAEDIGGGRELGPRFRLTRASVQAGAGVGLDPLAILEAALEHSRSPLPGNVRHEVAAWAAGVRAVAWERPLLLRCPDAETAERVLLAVGPPLEALDERTLLLTDEAALERVTKLAAEVGVHLEPPPAPPAAERKRRRRRWSGRRRRRRD